MTRKKHIVDTLARLAAVKEQQATLAAGRAADAERAALAAAQALEVEEQSGEAQLTGQGTLGTVERELLWAHRTWVQRERVITEERLALTAQQVAEAQARLEARKRDTRIRENVRDHVGRSEHAEREYKSQKELDEIATMRFTPKP
ncbi:MAG: hypothetical protein IT385_04530 [Deltaproteobacteria bacterium]|nr:hypothetical protein [Deltaproteobacteria bacterium]